MRNRVLLVGSMLVLWVSGLACQFRGDSSAATKEHSNTGAQDDGSTEGDDAEDGAPTEGDDAEDGAPTEGDDAVAEGCVDADDDGAFIGGIFCYEGPVSYASWWWDADEHVTFPGRILIEVANNTKLSIEHQPNATCSQAFVFAAAALEFNR